MSSFCINYLFDKQDTLYILQFTRGTILHQDTNKLVSCTKSVIAGQREEAEGELDVEELDRTPVILFKTNVDNMTSDMNVFTSPSTTEAATERCKRLAEAGPREVLAEVLPVYISECIARENELRYSGTVMKFEDNTAALYQGEPQKAHEIEMLVTMFFPELNQSQEKK